MATRTRTNGARIPSSGLTTTAGSITITGNFQNPKNGLTYSARTSPLSAGYNSFTDNRASITDETGSAGEIHPCYNVKTIVTADETPSAQFTQRNPNSPFGVMKTTLGGSNVPYNLENLQASNPHVPIPDGTSVALARVPSISKEVLSGLNSLYELKDTWDLINLLPIHFLWAAARRKRAESIEELEKWCLNIERTVKSPLQLLQTIAGLDLMWKFGLAPLKRDIDSVHAALEGINSKVQELLAKRFPVAGMFRDSRCEVINHGSSVSSDTLGCYTRSASTSRRTNKTWVFGALKRIDPLYLPTIDVLRNKTLIERLGLSFGATDIWEAVPWSFVVDWFLPVQTFLEQFSWRKPDPSWLITVGCWSSVKTLTVGTSSEVITPLTSANCVVDNASGLNRFMAFTNSEYDRRKLTSLPIAVPNTYIPMAQLPDFGQFITGLELALQKIRRKLR